MTASKQSQDRTPDDGQRRYPEHVEFYNNKIWIISASGWLFKKKSIQYKYNW
jgi:hypothetical protein